MPLPHFIRRNGKRKGNKVTESRCHQKSFSTTELSRVSPLVLDIHEVPLSLAAQRSPVVELNLSNSNEEWFPREWLQSRNSRASSSRRVENATAPTVTQNDLTKETRRNPSPVSSLSRSENASTSIAFRKKSIPAPIIIPDADYLIRKVQIGQSVVSAGLSPQTSHSNVNDAPLNPSSPSVSENLSSISGTTLARALIASSFVLSSCERRSSRHRSAVVRQDSATLPGSFFLSDPGSSSPIPPVPPVPEKLASVPPDSNCPSTTRSGASTESEYPLSDSYITSPEMGANSVIPRRISRIQEVPSPTGSTSIKSPPPVFLDTKSQQKAGPIPTRTRVPRNGVFDGPKTAVDVPLLIHSQDTSQEGSFILSSDDHSLDEYDFVPPEPLVMVATPESDSSASYIAPVQLFKRGDAGQWKRRVGATNLVRDYSKDNSLSDGSLTSHQAHGLPSASASEHDYGELLNYDLTVSPGTGTSLSSTSAGYQTFPETPLVFSPIWSTGFAALSKSDTHIRRRRISSLRSAGRGLGKLHSSIKVTRRQAGNNDGGAVILRKSRSSSFPRQKTPPPIQAESNLSPPVPENDEVDTPEQTNQLLTTDKVVSQQSVESADRRHPLAHISTSSSYVLEEEALRALAKHSPSSLPSVFIGDVDCLLDSMIVPVSVTDPFIELATSVPLPESTDVSSSSSPALASSSTMVSSSASPLESSLPTTSTAISQSQPSKSLLSPSSSSPRGSSFHPLASLDEPQIHSPMAIGVAPDDMVIHSPSPSFVPPPPYHAVVSERTSHHPGTPPLSRAPSIDHHHRSRQPSSSSLTSVRSRMRSRPPLPIGPRKPSVPGQVLGSLLPGIRSRNGSTSSVGSGDPVNGSGLPWRKLHSAASQPTPKFQMPPPKWRGLTLEAAQWTFSSAQLQTIVSQAIQQSSEGSSLRYLRPEVLEGEITDEMQRLELQHVDVKTQYKLLARKRWTLMGALAGYIEGVETNDVAMAVRTLEELAEVSSALDQLTDKMHDIVLQMSQLKSLRDVHNTSALAMAVRKINRLFVREMAEKERLQVHIDTLQTERDEAWKHAEDIAQDYDALNDRMSESVYGDASSGTGSKRSTRILAVRKSSVRQSQAGLRSRSRHRPGRPPSVATRPTSPALDDIPPVPRLPVNPPMGSSAMALSTGISFTSAYVSTAENSASLALAEAQREVYEMLGLSLPPSQASSRRRTMSGPDIPRAPSPSPRPVSESLDVYGVRMRRVRSRQDMGCAAKSASVTLEDCYPIRPLTIAER